MSKRVTYDILNGGVGSSNQNDHTDDEAESVQNGVGKVLLAEVRSSLLLDQLGPHHSREVERETGDEERRRDGEQIVEEGNSLCDDESSNGGDGDIDNPDTVALEALESLNVLRSVLVDTSVKITDNDHSVDRTRDENDGNGDTESDTAHESTTRQKSRGLDLRADKVVDDGTGESVDDNLNDSESPDGLHVVGRSVHFLHEGELANGEGVGENDVGHGNESLGESEARLGPRRPAARSKSANRLIALDTGGHHGDDDGNQDGNEIDVTEESHLRERGRQSHDQEQDGGNTTESESADALLGDNVSESNGTGKTVRADKEDKLQHEHGADNLITPSSSEKLSSVGIVADTRELELDLSDNPGSVNTQRTDTERANHTGNHTERGERLGETKTSESNSLNDQDDSELDPAKAVELILGMALLHVDHIHVVSTEEVILATSSVGRVSRRRRDAILLLLVAGGGLVPRGSDLVSHCDEDCRKLCSKRRNEDQLACLL